jgi:hypothetical protein
VSGDTAFPESWVPSQAGDCVEGAFVRLDEGYGRDGDVCAIVILRDSDGVEHGIWLWHLVLRSDFARLKPEVDEVVTVTYLGKRKSATGRAYHSYNVHADRESQLTWDDLEAESTNESLPKPLAEDDDSVPF